MIRQSPRLLLRACPPLRVTPSHRFRSTAPPAQKPRSWKSYAARLGLAFGAIYYYNTSQLFAEEPPFSIPLPQSPTDEPTLQTLESLAIKNRTPPPPTPELAASQTSQNATPTSKPPTSDTHPPSHTPETANPNPMPSTTQDLEATEEEASQEGAFNEATGEINWECPCLGGMAHGPCGEQFRAAFSCFVFSKDEPKGMDCIPNFKNMQDCFREHPDVYGAELDDDEEGQEVEDASGPDPTPAPAPVSVEGGDVPAAATSAPSTPAPASVSVEGGEVPAATTPPPNSTSTSPSPPQSLPAQSPTSPPTTAGITTQASPDEGAILVPKAAHDATSANTEK